MRIAILGAGMVGRAIAIDLSMNHNVTSFDISKVSLDMLKQRGPNVNAVHADLGAYANYKQFLKDFDLVV
ncbi:MAG: saccharopine dehydrogenase NADP-binding domain-containing protein, partial [Ginsengibacter sp.]